MDSGAVSQASWKVGTTTDEQSHAPDIPFERTRQFFAIDASGSTSGGIITRECDFVERLHEGHSNDKVTTWGSRCGDVSNDFSVSQWNLHMGGTYPSKILSHPGALDAIRESDVWYLLTDGEIVEYDVVELCNLAVVTAIFNIPVVFVITGPKRSTPSALNVSVGISFFANASDVLVLYKEAPTGVLYVLAGKGCFTSLVSEHGDTTPDLSTWSPLQRLADETELIKLCQEIQFPSAENRPKVASGTVSLGEQWERENNGTNIDIDILFSTTGMVSHTDIDQLLSEDAFHNLSVACKTRGRTLDLREFLTAQKMQEITIRLTDVSGASDIVSRLQDPNVSDQNREPLQQQLRDAHAKNRDHYQHALKESRDSGEYQAVRQRNQLINHAFEQLAALENSTYTADILARRSNRARRAGTVAEGGEVQVTSLDLDTPEAFRGDCRICCGEQEVMCIALKAGADAAFNTDNFLLDFPLAGGRHCCNSNLISSQYVCFQCALALDGMSIFREDLVAIIPTLDYSGSNKPYIQSQLYMGLTGGLRTGASGVSQLFMAILDRTMREKEWAGAGEVVADDEDPEVTNRRNMFRWVLKNMLARTSCRETFNEQGEWVTFREALMWAATDFQANDIDSWAIGYPTAGFMQLISFGHELGAFDAKTVRELRLAKLLRTVAALYLGWVLGGPDGQGSVPRMKKELLNVIYMDYNADLVPLDKRGADSLVNSPAVFWDRLTNFVIPDNDKILLANWDLEDQERAMRRVQLLAFWLIYHQREHVRPKTLFQKLRAERELSHAVLDFNGPAISAAASDLDLLSLFGGRPADSTFHSRHTTIPPFITPFGPSVLRCSFAGCAEPFVAFDHLPDPELPWTAKQCDTLRQGRAAHLIEVYGTDDRFKSQSQTGLPMVTETPEPPSSTHVNLHVIFARVWSQMSVEQRRLVAAGPANNPQEFDEFVERVVHKICESRRGDIFQQGLDEAVRDILPSFLEAVCVALRARGHDGTEVELYEHDWSENTLEAKAKYEMRLSQSLPIR